MSAAVPGSQFRTEHESVPTARSSLAVRQRGSRVRRRGWLLDIDDDIGDPGGLLQVVAAALQGAAAISAAPYAPPVGASPPGPFAGESGHTHAKQDIR